MISQFSLSKIHPSEVVPILVLNYNIFLKNASSYVIISLIIVGHEALYSPAEMNDQIEIAISTKF
jgi:hypothetical protein